MSGEGYDELTCTAHRVRSCQVCEEIADEEAADEHEVVLVRVDDDGNALEYDESTDAWVPHTIAPLAVMQVDTLRFVNNDVAWAREVLDKEGVPYDVPPTEAERRKLALGDGDDGMIATPTDTDAVNAIAILLGADEWSPDTLQNIAEIVALVRSDYADSVKVDGQ